MYSPQCPPGHNNDQGVSTAEVQAGLMLGAMLAAAAIVVPLAATGRGVEPVQVPHGTQELSKPEAQIRTFVPPAGLERYVSCGDTHSNLSTHSYARQVLELQGKTAVICGSQKDKLPNNMPKVTIEIAPKR